MKTPALLLLTLAAALPAFGQIVPSRCKTDKLESYLKLATSPGSLIDEKDKLIEKGNGAWRLKFGSEQLCEKAVWDDISQNQWNAGTVVDQIKILQGRSGGTATAAAKAPAPAPKPVPNPAATAAANKKAGKLADDVARQLGAMKEYRDLQTAAADQKHPDTAKTAAEGLARMKVDAEAAHIEGVGESRTLHLSIGGKAAVTDLKTVVPGAMTQEKEKTLSGNIAQAILQTALDDQKLKAVLAAVTNQAPPEPSAAERKAGDETLGKKPAPPKEKTWRDVLGEVPSLNPSSWFKGSVERVELARRRFETEQAESNRKNRERLTAKLDDAKKRRETACRDEAAEIARRKYDPFTVKDVSAQRAKDLAELQERCRIGFEKEAASLYKDSGIKTDAEIGEAIRARAESDKKREREAYNVGIVQALKLLRADYAKPMSIRRSEMQRQPGFGPFYKDHLDLVESYFQANWGDEKSPKGVDDCRAALKFSEDPKVLIEPFDPKPELVDEKCGVRKGLLKYLSDKISDVKPEAAPRESPTVALPSLTVDDLMKKQQAAAKPQGPQQAPAPQGPQQPKQEK